MGFTKLFSSIITSTVWMEDSPTRIVWVGLLALANGEGIVEGSIPGLANVCRVSVEECQRAIDVFLAPDAYSRNPDHDGRRIEPVPGGWRILNYRNYRSKGQDKDGSRADYMRRYRSLQESVTCNNSELHVIQKIEDRGKKKEKKKDSSSNRPTPPDDFLKFWAHYPNKKGRLDALKAWNAAIKKGILPPIEQILKALETQKQDDQWCKDGGQYIPHPATWLNQGRWDDQPIPWQEKVRMTK